MKNLICIRKFPFPYRCAVAICSDVDATSSTKKYIELQKFLCTDKSTSCGNGLLLEIGNSFWFFRNSDYYGLSYFDGLTKNETDFAPVCRELIKTGFVDVLHTFGDFNIGGFERKFAEFSIEEMIKHNLNIKTWVNHGNLLNTQNIGSLTDYKGADPTNKSYHLDLSIKFGIKYFWTSQLTHLVGQDSNLTTKNQFKNLLQRFLAIKYYGKQVNPFLSNRLMEKVKQKDGNEINTFMRFINPWGKYSYTDAKNFSRQLNSTILNELKINEGYLILYTHLGNYNNPNKILPDETVKELRNLASEFFNGEIFVTTPTRLLTYYEMFNSLKFEVQYIQDRTIISLRFKDTAEPKLEDLSGLTFYTSSAEKTSLFFNGKQLKSIINPADYTGKTSISIPLQKLDFPESIF
jgi:hypothetical protein